MKKVKRDLSENKVSWETKQIQCSPGSNFFSFKIKKIIPPFKEYFQIKEIFFQLEKNFCKRKIEKSK